MANENPAAKAQADAQAVGEKAQADAHDAEPKPGDWAAQSDPATPAWATDGSDNDADYQLPDSASVDGDE